MTLANPLIFKFAINEIIRPLKDYILAEVNGDQITLRVLKKGLSLKSRDLENFVLPAQTTSLKKISDWVSCILDENSSNQALHAKPQWLSTQKHTQSEFENDKAVLTELYKEDFISAEKKELIVDLESSNGHYLRSANNPDLYIFDAASQIASLNLGINSTKRHPLLMRPESESCLEKDEAKSDLKTALANLLKRQSGLKKCYFLASGSEANDFCLSKFKLKYPKRAKAFAFEGSFHGRTLLSLHTTHSPSKREPFEIYKGLVDFFAWPTNNHPDKEAIEPSEWLKHWSNPKETHQNPLILEWLKQKDPLLVEEICILVKIRKEFQSGNLPFALITEPMQCEGGDRYTTPRFMRALRLLTRAFDVPLVFDEVQTGFGLGGPFFWHKTFLLQTVDGQPDIPDAVTVAKKAQAGACLTNENWNHEDVVCHAGWHRGYLQAQAALEGPEVDDILKLTLNCLKLFAEHTIPEWVQNPRGKGFAVAFDLPSAEIANAMIKFRFENGILIYPAGEKTLRFRLMTTTRRRDIYEMFTALYGCLNDAKNFFEQTKNIEISSVEAFQTKLKQVLNLDEIDFHHKYSESVTKDQSELPKSIEEISKFDSLKWQKVFRTLMRLYPELSVKTKISLSDLNKLSSTDLIKKYQESSNCFSWKDLLWELSRKLSFKITLWGPEDIETHRDQINQLQHATYEPARRASVDLLKAQAEDSRTLSLACIEDDGTLAGMCIAVPLEMATDLPYFFEPPESVTKHDLYSTDLTVDSNHRSNGLGLRLKVEQMIAARQSGMYRITSRNRYPEAKAMSRLNQKMGAVVCHISHKDYGGSGTGLYQSIELKAPQKRLVIFKNKSTLLNKMCLSNFVSMSYINFLKIWKEVLPTNLKHLYLSSGESEATDKWIKTLYASRPKATHALSFYGDFFGCGTACAQSLGGKQGAKSPFEWPRLDANNASKSLIDYVKSTSADEILGVFVEPTGKPWLKDFVETCRSLQIPVIFNETRSAFGKFNQKLLLAIHEITPDGFMIYGGNQIAINAVSNELFISKPLTMISTWDGDEWSLQIFTEKLIQNLDNYEMPKV